MEEMIKDSSGDEVFFFILVGNVPKVASTVVGDQVYTIPLYTLSSSKWVGNDTVLTEPDLADSVEALLARSAAGAPPQNKLIALNTRVYPVDPLSQQTAQRKIAEIVDNLTKQIDADKIVLSDKYVENQKIEKQKMFDEFKQKQVEQNQNSVATVKG